MCIQITIHNQKGWTAATFRLTFVNQFWKFPKKILFLHYYLCKKFLSTLLVKWPIHLSSRWSFPHSFSFHKLETFISQITDSSYKKLHISISKISEFFKITDFQTASFRFVSQVTVSPMQHLKVTKQNK